MRSRFNGTSDALIQKDLTAFLMKFSDYFSKKKRSQCFTFVIERYSCLLLLQWFCLKPRIQLQRHCVFGVLFHSLVEAFSSS